MKIVSSEEKGALPRYPRVTMVIGVVSVLLGVLLLLPGLRSVQVILDRKTGTAEGMTYTWGLHLSLAPRYEVWAKEWLGSKRGEVLTLDDISGTEWPLFGSVFFLEATEALQAQWKTAGGKTEPMSYARDAVEAATALVLSPSSATWVKRHWGENYLDQENAFYRMLLVRAIVAHHHLTGSVEHLEMLRGQVDGLMREIDASPAGLLDDYPHQCYPSDIAATVAAIRRASAILGIESTAFVSRAIRGFTGDNVGRLGLPPYYALRETGQPYDDSRGCSNSYLLLSTPVAWPEQAAKWYGIYEKHFWQWNWLSAGWREFPHDRGNWLCRNGVWNRCGENEWPL